MSLEKVKTIILTLLVLLSLLLTWLIWNNQPNYDWLNLKDLDNIAIAKEKRCPASSSLTNCFTMRMTGQPARFMTGKFHG